MVYLSLSISEVVNSWWEFTSANVLDLVLSIADHDLALPFLHKPCDVHLNSAAWRGHCSWSSWAYPVGKHERQLWRTWNCLFHNRSFDIWLDWRSIQPSFQDACSVSPKNEGRVCLWFLCVGRRRSRISHFQLSKAVFMVPSLHRCAAPCHVFTARSDIWFDKQKKSETFDLVWYFDRRRWKFWRLL